MGILTRSLNLLWGDELLKSGAWGVYISLPKNFINEAQQSLDIQNTGKLSNSGDINLKVSSYIKSINIPVKSNIRTSEYRSSNKAVLSVPVGTNYDGNTITLTIIESRDMIASYIFNTWFYGIDACLNAKWAPSNAVKGPTIYMGELYIWLANETMENIKYAFFLDYIYPIHNLIPSDFSDEVNDKIQFNLTLNSNFVDFNQSWIINKCENYNKLLKNKMIEKLSVIFS